MAIPADDPLFSGTDLVDRLLERGLESTSHQSAVVSRGAQFSWRELASLSDLLAAHYLARGLRPGDRLASLMPNGPDLLVHYLACLKAGIVATPLNYRYVADEIDHALQVSQASLLLHHRERDDGIAQSHRARNLPLGILRSADTEHDGLLAQLTDEPAAGFTLPELTAEAPAFIYMTSGSTGRPKGVTHSRRSLSAMIRAVILGMEITPGDTLLPASSLSHIGGSLFSLATLAAGGQVVIAHSSGGSEVLSQLREFRPTILFMLPAPLRTLVEDHAARKSDFVSIRLCLSGGDKVGLQLESEFSHIAGLPIDESYGMSEIGLATLNPPAGENRPGSVGQLCPGFEASLRTAAGEDVADGTPGQLWIRSPTLMSGYWDNPQATAEIVVDGWLDTGDLMRRDPEGYYWFCGRQKQIIVHDGSNICPQEVEEAILQHPAIAAAGIIGIDDAVHGQNVRAFVTLRDGASRPTAEEVIRVARQHIGYKAPEEVVFLDEIPLNATGKVDRGRLKQLVESGQLVPQR